MYNISPMIRIRFVSSSRLAARWLLPGQGGSRQSRHGRLFYLSAIADDDEGAKQFQWWNAGNVDDDSSRACTVGIDLVGPGGCVTRDAGYLSVVVTDGRERSIAV